MMRFPRKNKDDDQSVQSTVISNKYVISLSRKRSGFTRRFKKHATNNIQTDLRNENDNLWYSTSWKPQKITVTVHRNSHWPPIFATFSGFQKKPTATKRCWTQRAWWSLQFLSKPTAFRRWRGPRETQLQVATYREWNNPSYRKFYFRPFFWGEGVGWALVQL